MRVTRLLFRLDMAAGVLGLGLVGASLVGMSSATAADSVSDGSDWGAQGLLSSNSAQTATWDNTGNSADSTVPRDADQTLPHTDGKTYDDVAAADRTAYASHFGPDDGKGGLKVTVSQTQSLVNQSVTVSLSGANPDIPHGTTTSNSYFQVFQCWGAMGSNGQPDPDATSPDPQSCQVGATGSDTIGGNAKRELRIVAGDPLITGGDWAKYNQVFPPVEVPFQAIDGTLSGNNIDNTNTFFDHTSTNEYSHVTVPATGQTSRQFEMQTGTESQGLGCGYRTDETSTSTCWLVVVPRIEGVDIFQGPISPSVWAQRMQFKLDFQNTTASCGNGSRSLLGGSEMLAKAMASWIPGICTADNVNLGYNRLGDEAARNQYAGSQSDAILTSNPLPAASNGIDVPIALTAPVLAFNIDYHPVCTNFTQDIHKVTTDAKAVQCGYDDLADLQADLAKEGQPIRDLKLDATMVAKLLTMSYQGSIIGCEGSSCTSAVSNGTLPEWAEQRPADLAADPEFTALNPQLHLSPYLDLSDLVLEGIRSDAAARLWAWLLADPDASAFLSGCPDAHGVTINPFFSSRTYTGCTADATALAAANQAERQATDTAPNFADNPITYPPTGSPYPLPQWQQRDATADQGVYTLVDQFPPVVNMQTGARDVGIGYKPRNGQYCQTIADTSCQPAPGRWKDPKLPQSFGTRTIMTVTDTPSAARYQLPTAALCNDAGSDCVQADTASLQKAASGFVATAVPGFVGPPGTNDYAGGAYPLTLPVYAVVRPTLSDAVRASYATAFGYIVGSGQTAGYDAGDLPPGYAPISSSMAAAASTGISTLKLPTAVIASRASASATPKPNKAHPTSPSATTSSTASSSASTSPATTTTTGPGDNGGLGAPSGGAPSTAPSATPAAASSPAAAVQTMAVSASTQSWPSWVLPLGLGLALGAGLAGPFLRRRSNLRLG